MNKLVFLAVVLALVATASAQVLTSGGVRDWAGNYYDLTTGQLSSSLTGRVYNTGALPLPYAVGAPVW